MEATPPSAERDAEMNLNPIAVLGILLLGLASLLFGHTRVKRRQDPSLDRD